jgi:rod shape determining protein RodA
MDWCYQADLLALFDKTGFLSLFILVFMIIHFILILKYLGNPIIYVLLLIILPDFTLSVDYVYENVLEPSSKVRIVI